MTAAQEQSGAEAKRFKRGDVREDGKVFWQYTSRATGRKELWATQASFEKWKETERRWKASNKDKLKQHHARNRARNGAKYNGRLRERYATDNSYRQKIRAACNSFRAKNREAINAKERGKPITARSKASTKLSEMRARGCVPDNYNHEAVVCIFEMRIRVQKCLGIEMNIDHILPIAAGGYHHHRNMQVLPRAINMLKRNSLFYQVPVAWKQVIHGYGLGCQ